MPSQADAVFPWVLQLDQATVLQLLTFLVASSVTGVSGVERDRQSTDALAQALALDMTRWWQPTGGAYLNHVSKGRILDVVAKAAGAIAASPLTSLKKDAVVAGAEQALAGTGWLPECLRTQKHLLRTVEEADAASAVRDGDSGSPVQRAAPADLALAA